jgi:hypothetical protein
MGKRETQSPESPKVSPRGTALVIFGTILDTTWRMFIPVLSLLVLGLWLDTKTGHKPLFTLGGVLLGFGLAIALVYQQYRQVTPPERSKR